MEGPKRGKWMALLRLAWLLLFAAGQGTNGMEGTWPSNYPSSGKSGVECGQKGQRQDLSHIDAVLVMVTPMCTTKQVIEYLEYWYSFRQILIIIKHGEYCPYLKSLSSHVVCIPEDQVLPGVSKETLAAVSQSIIKNQGGSNRVGWYMQQYLKLGVSLWQNVSDHYLVWDADNIMMDPINFFSGQAVRFCMNPVSWKQASYGKFYFQVTGLPLLKPGRAPKPGEKSWSHNFVCGYMMFYKPYVKEMLAHITRHMSRKRELPAKFRQFPWDIHYVANSLIKDRIMFSEYDSYGSWVKKHHPEAYAEDPKVTYTRNPDRDVLNPDKPLPKPIPRFNCCLDSRQICKLAKKEGPSASGFHNILIWEEHKMRLRSSADQCTDPLPPQLAQAMELVGNTLKVQA